MEYFQVEFRAVQQRIHDLNQEMEVGIRIDAMIATISTISTISMHHIIIFEDNLQARISVAIEAVAADLRHIYVLTNTGDIMTFDFGDSRYVSPSYSCSYNSNCLISEELRRSLTIEIFIWPCLEPVALWIWIICESESSVNTRDCESCELKIPFCFGSTSNSL